ncbi:acyl-CoA N-acyltransferase [Apodospora peruviana]|uniref:Acyl-CoA N-acyltransferase n=1 Tax=Apodospora peruviana TaxID=516989 RepID=A0AAE0IQ43_9PEZI|nr:acyl-CoA N-acyltransferase [Apodospora peruviana]
MEPITAPIITRPRFIIRPYDLSDAPDFAPLCDNPKISHYMRNTFPSPYTQADAEAWVKVATEREPLRNFAICVLSSDSRDKNPSVCGGIGLIPKTDVESHTMEIGYWLGEPYWGSGIMTETVIAFSWWAFENVEGLERLEAGVFGDNEASVQVLTKAGFKFEGARRRAGFKHGGFFDIRVFGLLREDLLELE